MAHAQPRGRIRYRLCKTQNESYNSLTRYPSYTHRSLFFSSLGLLLFAFLLFSLSRSCSAQNAKLLSLSFSQPLSLFFLDLQPSRLSSAAVYKMSEELEYRCFIGGLAWSTSDRSLKEAFDKYGKLVEAKVVVDKFSGRSRGFGFVTFDDKKAMDEAIEEMNGMDLDGRTITVDKAQPHQGGGRDYDGGRDRDRGGRDRDRGYGGGRGGGGGGDCFKCGKPGHFARECPSEGSRGGGGRYGGRDDKYSGGGGGRDDKYSGGGGRDDKYSGGGGGRDRYGPDRNGDRYSGRSRDSGSGGRASSGSDRFSRDRSGPYERRGTGGFRSG